MQKKREKNEHKIIPEKTCYMVSPRIFTLGAKAEPTFSAGYCENVIFFFLREARLTYRLKPRRLFKIPTYIYCIYIYFNVRC